jgi:6-pyruvoyltetrahydropterin/6-carboxytetrahydropterin synthase
VHPIDGEMFLTRKAEFSASHVCANPDWSEARNREVYGNNANPNGHGHNYVLEVTVEGDPDPVTGMVFDLREIKEILNREVVDPMDHRFLNREVPPFDRVVPTAENVAVEIWRRIEPPLRRDNARLRNVRLYETPDLYVDYGGEA